ncbi:MAG: hypothetical protein QOH99_660, partial [Frankiaceae bacterium]|nr:hypothetical protein [Frankiaceae bacterium]
MCDRHTRDPGRLRHLGERPHVSIAAHEDRANRPPAKDSCQPADVVGVHVGEHQGGNVVDAEVA